MWGFDLVGVGAGTPIIVIVATIPFWGDVAAGVVVLSIMVTVVATIPSWGDVAAGLAVLSKTVTVGVSVGGVAVRVIRTVFALFVGTERETS